MAKKETVINDTTILRQSASPEGVIEKSWKAAFDAFANSEKVDIFVPDVYRAAFGDPMHFSVNGISIMIPIGEKIKVPKPFADHAQRMMKGAILSKGQTRLTPEELYED
jgi:hypothetical protein